MKITRHRRLLIALLVIIVGLLGVVGWLVWPEAPPKYLTLRLKYVRSEVVDGKSNLLFRIEGAEKYEIYVRGFLYLNGKYPVAPFTSLQNHLQKGREFYTTPPSYSGFNERGWINEQGWKLQAEVFVVVQDGNFSKLYSVVRNTWRHHTSGSNQSLFSLAKSLWQGPSIHSISQQSITSDVITNAPPK